MTTDTLRQVFGTLRTPNGSAFPNKSLKWFRERRVVVGQGSSVVLDEPFIVATDAVGEIDIDVMAGAYLVLAPLSDADRYFRVVVPDQAGPFDISSLIDGPTVEPDDLTQFEALVAKAKAWANAPEDSVVESGEFSAKHYAAKAEEERIGAQAAVDAAVAAALAKAEEWAENPEDVEVEAGKYSAKHWSVKSEEERVASEAARTGSELAATNAAAARDAAFVNAAVYATTAAGLAATTTGQQFQVVSGDEIIRYRHDAGPVATEVARYPAAAAVDPLQRTNLSIFAVEDADGNLGLDVQSPFRINESGGIETAAFLEVSEPRKWLWAVSDLDGNIPIGIDHLGRLVADFSLVPTGQTAFKTGGTYDYTVNHVFCYGQSLSVGQALPIQSGTAKFDHLMFTRGMRPQYDYPAETVAQWYAALVPAVEALSPTQPSLGETPSRGTGDAIKELIEAEDGKAHTDHEYKLLLSNPGFGALTIVQLSKGTTHFSRMVQQAQYGLSLANAQGDTYAVQAVTWIQGESDYLSGTTQAAYLSALNTLVSDIQTDLKAVTGQSKRIAVIGYQVASHINGASDDIPDIALAQLECAEANANFFIATPMYHFPYADGFHLTGPGSQWLGAYLGLAYKRIVIDGEDWSPVRPIASVRQGSIAEVRFHVPKGRLVFDTTTVADQPSKGFQLVDSGGSPLTISNVEIVDFDRVRITAAASIPAGAKLRYAWQGNSAVGLGNLRDTQGDTIAFDPEGVNRPLHNWCVIFERSL